jgi:hypothetical protein
MSIYSPLSILIENLIDLLKGGIALGIELLEDIADFLSHRH